MMSKAIRIAAYPWHDRIPLARRHSPLHKDQQTLVPQNRQLLLFLLANPSDPLHTRVCQSDKVEYKGVHDLVRQRVLLVKEYSNEERVGTGIVHVG
jgi:hypothetical protein